MPWRRFLTIGAALLLAISSFIIFLLLYPISPISSTKVPVACGCTVLPTVWEVREDQVSVQDANGIFALKYIRLSSRAFNFFYVYMLHAQGGAPTIQVLGSSSHQTIAPISYAAKTQPLGRLGGFSLGVVQMDHINDPGQTLTLQITLPGASKPAWSLPFLKQIAAEEQFGSVLNKVVDDRIVPQIQFKGWISSPAQNAQFAFFRFSPPSAIPKDMFLRIADDGQVSVISKEEYISLFGEDSLTE